MRVLALPILREFWERYPEAETALRTWFVTLETAEPAHLNALKQTFGSVDYVPDRHDDVGWYVFDVGGNKWRVICKISFRTGYALIKEILTHEEYDAWTKENR